MNIDSLHRSKETQALSTLLEMSRNDPGFQAALSEAKKGASEGGVPIGACLVDKDGKILGQGHNLRVQKGSAILHVCTTFYLFPHYGRT